MNSVLLRFDRVGKCFQIYQVRKTLFRLGHHLSRGVPLKRELWALRGVSFEAAAGEKIALLGRNGAGKTTLLRLAAGIFQPTEGVVHRHADIAPLFRYGIGLNPHLSVLDNIYVIGAFYGLLKRQLQGKADAILQFSELGEFAHVPVKSLSLGQVLRLSFAVFIQSEEKFLAFDESTYLGDLGFQRKVEAYLDRLMRDPERTVLMASHSLETIRRYCQRAIWLERGEIKEIGPPDAVVQHYSEFCIQGAGSVSDRCVL
jgi:teichoic acid transport system ATP-binding protein